MSCRDPSDDACAVARHAEHVEGRGGRVCARGGIRIRTTLRRCYRVSRVCSLLSLLYFRPVRYHSLWRMADYMVIMVDIATSLPGSWSHAAIEARSATPTAGLERRSRVARSPPASGGAFSCLRAAMRAALIAAFAAGIAGCVGCFSHFASQSGQ